MGTLSIWVSCLRVRIFGGFGRFLAEPAAAGGGDASHSGHFFALVASTPCHEHSVTFR